MLFFLYLRLYLTRPPLFWRACPLTAGYCGCCFRLLTLADWVKRHASIAQTAA